MLPKDKFAYIFLIFTVFLLSVMQGCASGLKNKNIVKEDVIYKHREKPVIKHEGSLWQDNGLLSEMFINPKAKNVGDIVTVKIIESSSASNKASTVTGRKSSLSGGLEAFFNAEKRFPSEHPFFNPFSKIKGGMESDFDGSGTTKRSGDLTAYLTARITQELPNGNLKIVGRRDVLINDERQLITLSGIIRPRDITPENEILSTYISDARIEYSGSGVISDRQHTGWASRIINKIWPF